MKRPVFRLVCALVALFGASLGLSSCADDLSTGVWVEPTVTLTRQSEPLITDSDVTRQTYRAGAENPYDAMPTSGEVNVLVIPVEFSGYRFADGVVKDIDTLFNGTDEETNYWKSVSSFYEESSFGKLDIKGTVSEVYFTNLTPEAFLKAPDPSGQSTNGTSSVVSLLRGAVAHYKSVHGSDSTKAFDRDGDGVIDGVYLIYSFYDYQTAEENGICANPTYWAFTARDTLAPDKDAPIASNFVWASYDFMYGAVKKGVGVDAHTYIHETGHMMGLDDYYNYDQINANANIPLKYRNFTPTGALDMMDYNILDHDCYSKFALGWTSPYLIDSSLDFPLTVTLRDSVSSNGDFIIIPDASSVYGGSAFGEYLMLELYAPTGLNALDSGTAYRGNRPKGFRSAGLKISHVDSRLVRVEGNTATYVNGVTKSDLASASPSGYYVVAASNTPSYSLEKEGYRLLHLLESGASLTFDNYDEANGTAYDSVSYATDFTLFSGNAKRNGFSMDRFASFFENGAKFNDGNEFGYSLKVNKVRSSSEGACEASITISKN
jgi:M6 family metalloprotease-like protein